MISARLEALKRRHDLEFLVASDPRHQLIDRFNIGFTDPGADRILGTGRSVLPYGTVVVADRAGVIRLAEVRADWTTPVRPARISAAVTTFSRRRA